MNPTCKLRIVEREVFSAQQPPQGRLYLEVKEFHQQWWEDPTKTVWDSSKTYLLADGEWRDIPVEKE
jgi:hypothetical protein